MGENNEEIVENEFAQEPVEETIEDAIREAVKEKAAAIEVDAERNMRPVARRKRRISTYKIFMSVISISILGTSIASLVTLCDLSNKSDKEAIRVIDEEKNNSDDNVSGGVLDTSVPSEGDLTLSQIQEMSYDDIIDTYLISKTNASKNAYKEENFVQDNKFWYYEEKGKKISKTGIDVSSYQGDIDWKRVKEDGVEFAIIRVGIRGYGTGKLVEDECFKANIEGAIKEGIEVGVYFFSQAITTKEAKEEAEFVCERIKDYDLSYPVIFDTEHVSASSARTNKANLSADERTDIALAFCDYVEEEGYESMIYSNKRWYLRKLNLEKLDKKRIWLAQYSSDLDYPFKFEIWQYSCEGRVDGIEGNVDLNIHILKD